MNENIISIFFFLLSEFYLLHVLKIIVFGCIKEEIKSILRNTEWMKFPGGEVEKSHSSSKRAEYVLRLLSAQCNTFSVWRV